MVNLRAALHLGLTGGIGSGKSTVANFFTQLGATVIDADAISRAVTAPHGAAVAQLTVEFGADFITSEGALNRDKMRDLVYADASARKRLETIVHPLVGQEIARQSGAATQVGSCCLVFDIPLLVESSHWRQRLHQVLVVDCSEARQIERVMARSALAGNAMTREAVQGIVRTQATRAQRLQASDAVICNDLITLTQLELEVTEFWRRLGLSSE
jgi:dephospho-CoA kinase